MAYFLGIDGGGSTIRVALIDEQEKPVAHFKLHRNSNPTSTGFDYLKETLEQILHKLQPFACEITAIIINLAGVGASQQLIRTKQIVREVFDETKTVHVYHDAHGSLLANSPQEAAILVICGTGSAIVGKDTNEHVYRAGGWGYLLGDEASGFWLVKTLFQEYLSFHDGVRDDDRAFDVFREQFEKAPRDALYRFYEADHRRDTASLSVIFLNNTYPLVQQIVREGIDAIKNRIEALRSVIKDNLKTIYYMGGMFESPFFQDAFKQILGDKIPLKQGKMDIEIELAMIGKEKEGRDDT